MSKFSSSNKIIIYSAFIVSGISGLIYESVWSQYLGLFLGHAAYAQTLTLAIFMGGMSVGAWVVSRKISKIKNALFLYVIIEFVLGIFGLFFHTIFTTTIDFSFATFFPYINNSLVISVFKWLIASLLILPQSILLGATFPLISSGLIRRIKINKGKIISVLYFTNSIGAAFGALFSTFLLIPKMGMPGTLMVAAILNILIAIILYFPSKNKEDSYNTLPQSIIKNNKNKINIPNKLILVVAALTGLASFIYEITWIRMLNLVLGTTLHSFEIMLSAFIFGLAMGGFWIKNRIDNIKNTLKYLGVIQVVMGSMALLTMPLYLESFTWVSDILNNVLQRTSTGYLFYNFLTGGLAIIIMIPAAFCAGMTFPILTKILFDNGDDERAIGKIYSSNTIGALLGVWFAIHIGMTVLGLKYMLIFATSVDAIIGVFLIYKSTQYNHDSNKNTVTIISSLLYLSLVIIIIINVDFLPKTLSSGTYRTAKSSQPASAKTLYYKNGKSASISVMSQIRDGNDLRVIATNGKPDASLYVSGNKFTNDEPTMVLAAAIPLLIKPEAKFVANIGFGSGLTAQTLLASENIKKLDNIEIENEIIQGAKLFYSKNYRAYDDPRSNIIIDDAKTYFASNNTKYDIIISEPSNPWVLGVGNLFSKEFYTNIQRYLKKDGLLVQWIQLYEIRPQVLSSAINALSSKFKYYDAYLSNSADLIFIASNSNIDKIKFATMDEVTENLRVDLNRLEINSISSIKSRKIGSQSSLSTYFKNFSYSINSDYFPILSLEAPKDRFMQASSNTYFAYRSFNVPAFELIDTNEDFNKIVNENTFDKFHPFTQGIQKSLDFLEYLKDKNNSLISMDTSSYGLSDVFNHPENFCGKGEIVEAKWLDVYVNIYDLAIIYGVDKVKESLHTENTLKCSKLAINETTKWVIESLKLFTSENYLEYIRVINSKINVLELSNDNIKRSLINKAIFSVIKLKEDRPKIENYQEIINANNTSKNDDTANWLISFL